LPDIALRWTPTRKAPRSKKTVTPWETSYRTRGTLVVKNLLPYDTPSTGSLEFLLSQDENVDVDDIGFLSMNLGAVRARKSLKLKVDVTTFADPAGWRILAINRDADRSPENNRALSVPIVAGKSR
jgi:hypothetical protein